MTSEENLYQLANLASLQTLKLLKEARLSWEGTSLADNQQNIDTLTSGTVLALLGTLEDKSGYHNVVTPSAGQELPFQITTLDGKAALSLITNKTELSISSIVNLLPSSGATLSGATLYCVYTSYSEIGVQELIRTNPGSAESWWRFSNGSGYFGVFRSTRLENYPATVGLKGNFLISIHSRTNDYEIFINNQSQGIVSGNYSKGDRFILCPQGRYNDCSLHLLLVVPSWIDKTSLFHKDKLRAIKNRFPGLPFSL